MPGIDELREVVPLLRQLAVRPENAVGHFVADLDHLRKHARIAKGSNRVARVLEYCLHEVRV